MVSCPGCGAPDDQSCYEGCPKTVVSPWNDAQLLSSGKDDWETPDDLFALYDSTYHFVLDAAANESNHKCPLWLGPGGLHEDALSISWHPWLMSGGNIWLNPPYSKGNQAKFVTKAFQEVFELYNLSGGRKQHGSVVCLLPARTDTKLFHEVIQPWGRIHFIKGRVKFKGASQGAPFPSMIVVFE